MITLTNDMEQTVLFTCKPAGSPGFFLQIQQGKNINFTIESNMLDHHKQVCCVEIGDHNINVTSKIKVFVERNNDTIVKVSQLIND